MKRIEARGLGPSRLHRRPGRARRAFRAAILTIAALSLGLLLWPYAALWRLDAAVRSGDPEALSDLVDLDSVRGELKKRLNKDLSSSIDTLSDPFISWLEGGIRTMGHEAVDRLVTLDWVRGELLRHSPPGKDRGFLGQVTYAFFDASNGFRVRIGPEQDLPVRVRMCLTGVTWQVTAVYH